MRIHLVVLFAAALLALGCRGNGTKASSLRAGSKEVTFVADDGGRVYGDLYPAMGPKKGLILMFHQAGSNSLEYAPIIPRVAGMGFECLAVDLRSGGNMFDGNNRTAANYKGKQSYDDAYHDMDAAFKWASAKGYKNILAWGSSYSSSLVFRLASEHPEVRGVLAFSPGEYMSQKGIVQQWISACKVPVLMSFTQDEFRKEGQGLFSALPNSPQNVLVAFPDGVHGSATLRADRNEKGMASYWSGVETFLGDRAK